MPARQGGVDSPGRSCGDTLPGCNNQGPVLDKAVFASNVVVRD